MIDILETIKQTKLEEVTRLKQNGLPEKAEVRNMSFSAALKSKIAAGKPALIAEVKKASPSKGIIRGDFDPLTIAKAYENAGAACISVLTDRDFFQGTNEYLTTVKQAVQIPILRKDFIIAPIQIEEAQRIGADCILLIMAMLELPQAMELEAAAMSMGLEVLIEVHNDAELKQALKLNSPMIGINNRNLKTFEVDINTSLDLSKALAAKSDSNNRILIAESGINNNADIQLLQAAGIHCFLVGESLMRQDDVEVAVQRLLGMV